MRGTKWFWFTVMLFGLMAVFACGNESYDDEYYDNGSYSDENYADDDVTADEVSNEDDYYMLPEDCYDDAYCRDAAIAVETAKKLMAIRRGEM